MGATYKDIASQLGVTSKTARNHLANLYLQLGVHNRAEAVMSALRLGLVDPSPVAAQAEANASSTSPRSAATIVVLKGSALRRPQEE